MVHWQAGSMPLEVNLRRPLESPEHDHDLYLKKAISETAWSFRRPEPEVQARLFDKDSEVSVTVTCKEREKIQ